MWAYMASFYIEASPETRKHRLPYLLTSLVILVLSSASSIVFGVQEYLVLYNIAPGRENIEAAGDILFEFDLKFFFRASLLGDMAYRVADAVLVSSVELREFTVGDSQRR